MWWYAWSLFISLQIPLYNSGKISSYTCTCAKADSCYHETSILLFDYLKSKTRISSILVFLNKVPGRNEPPDLVFARKIICKGENALESDHLLKTTSFEDGVFRLTEMPDNLRCDLLRIESPPSSIRPFIISNQPTALLEKILFVLAEVRLISSVLEYPPITFIVRDLSLASRGTCPFLYGEFEL